jgi:small nuclear ribonucleoprotein (snRNP)-like protein
MKTEEVAVFAYKFATHNERIVITLKDNSVLRGHFINNLSIEKKVDNYWNFVILRVDNEQNTKMIINGDDILSIKKVQIF